MKTKIYGASDDLIEIEGAISDEVGTLAKWKKITASDGTIAKISYDGIWNIHVDEAGRLYENIIRAVGDEEKHTHEDAVGCSSYSDVLVFSEGIEWVKIGGKTFRSE